MPVKYEETLQKVSMQLGVQQNPILLTHVHYKFFRKTTSISVEPVTSKIFVSNIKLFTLLNEYIFPVENGNNFFEGIFREAIWPCLVFAQVFGLFPVNGIKNRSISKLQFKWFSLHVCHSLIVATILILYCMLLIWKTMVTQVGFASIGL